MQQKILAFSGLGFILFLVTACFENYREELKSHKYYPKTGEELKKLVQNPNVDLSQINTSGITDMSFLFEYSKRKDFSGIETWDTSNVQSMYAMFLKAEVFNHPLNDWNVSSVKTIKAMFAGAKQFNQPLDKWDTSGIMDMRDVFYQAHSFNQPLNSWDVSKVKNMGGMFSGTESFNQPLNNWDVSSVEDMELMFSYASSFNQNLNNWDVSKVKDTYNMFSHSPLEKNPPRWYWKSDPD